jgi:hypothetical protein
MQKSSPVSGVLLTPDSTLAPPLAFIAQTHQHLAVVDGVSMKLELYIRTPWTVHPCGAARQNYLADMGYRQAAAVHLSPVFAGASGRGAPADGIQRAYR